MKKLMVLCVLWLTALPACTTSETIEPADHSGFYKVNVDVYRRSYVFDSTESNSSFMYQNYIHKDENQCCEDISTKYYDCPEAYIVQNLKIFKFDNTLYLRNVITYGDNGNRTTLDFPLSERNDSLVYEIGVSKIGDGTFYCSQDSHPGSFDLLYFAVDLSNKDITNGKLIFKKKVLAGKTGLQYFYCTASEFSELEFVKTP
jgi:hypothetical protein